MVNVVCVQTISYQIQLKDVVIHKRVQVIRLCKEMEHAVTGVALPLA